MAGGRVLSFVFTHVLLLAPAFPGPASGQAPAACVSSLQSPVPNRTQHLPAGVPTQHLLWWLYTNFWGSTSCGCLPPLVDGFPCRIPRSWIPGEFIKVSSLPASCLHVPQKSVLGSLVPTEIPCLPASAQSPVDQNSTQISVQWISLVVEAESWPWEGGLFQVCFFCGYTPSAPGFSLSSLSSAVGNVTLFFLYSKKCDLKLIINIS